MIYDEDKQPFYWHTNRERSITFNLPIGKYYTPNDLTRKLKFVPYGNEKYPLFKGKAKTWLKRLKIYSYKNPNKASISLDKGVIIVDPQYYYNKYKPCRVFTLKHEVYHYFFHCQTMAQKENRFIHQHYEKECDNAAKAWMLANGYNPTQISLAIKLLLKGQERKDCMQRMTTDPKNKFRR
jgi:hypothetical protein